MYKTIKTKEQARELITSGVDKAADVVKLTMGPYGKNVMLHRRNRKSEISNDGKKIIENIVLENEVENAALDHVKEAANQTATVAGDGTTSCAVLLQSIYHEGLKKLYSNSRVFGKESTVSVMEVLNDIRNNLEKVLERLRKMAKPVKTSEELVKIATTSVEDKEIGQAIGEMVFNLGEDCVLVIEESERSRIETESISGMRSFCGYGQEFQLAHGKPIKRLRFKDTAVLLTNHEFKNAGEFMNLVNKFIPTLSQNGFTSCVMFGGQFSMDILKLIIDNSAKFPILPIKSRYLSVYEFEDIALFTGARFIDVDRMMKLEELKSEDFGSAKEIFSEPYHTAILGGVGSKEAIAVRVSELKTAIADAEGKSEKERLEKRLAGLAGGYGFVRVGAKTDTEKGYIYDKVEDCIRAAKCALKEGVVKGGGLALKEIAEKMPKNILTESLKAPYNQIQENAGRTFEVPDDVIDPAKVVRVALENACSAAGVLLTTDAAIVERNDEIEVLRKLINHEIDIPSETDYLPDHMKEQYNAMKNQ